MTIASQLVDHPPTHVGYKPFITLLNSIPPKDRNIICHHCFSWFLLISILFWVPKTTAPARDPSATRRAGHRASVPRLLLGRRCLPPPKVVFFLYISWDYKTCESYSNNIPMIYPFHLYIILLNSNHKLTSITWNIMVQYIPGFSL